MTAEQTVNDQRQMADFPTQEDQEEDTFSWEDSYAIALALREAHPDASLEEVSLGMIYEWTLALSRFYDDRELANEAILAAIYQEWFEEVNPL
jgi:FeS assembly protein IscX